MSKNGCVGGYSLDCYCDNSGVRNIHGPGHTNKCGDTNPALYYAETGAVCRANARRDGWRIDYVRNVFLCPQCNPKSKAYKP